jgi:hypothetical protein
MNHANLCPYIHTSKKVGSSQTKEKFPMSDSLKCKTKGVIYTLPLVPNATNNIWVKQAENKKAHKRTL